MRPQARKTSPKVLGVKVQRKNRWDETRTYWNTRQSVPLIDREEPGRGYRHVLKRKDIFAFIELMPDWEEISHGLDAIVLAAGSDRADGWHRDGVIGLCAWERDLWRVTSKEYHEEHAELFARLGVPCEPEGDDFTLKFSESTAAAFQLLHVLPHELGHHHDRMTTRSQREASRGERYAEDYAVRYERRIWDSYFRVFGAV